MTDPSFSPQVRALLDRGVAIPSPATVTVGPEVQPDRISPGAVVHPGTRLYGSSLSIGPGCELGAETPVTVRDAQLERDVALKGGFVDGAVLLAGANLGSGAHVRSGTLLEEEAGGAHTVGLKQTVLLPFVTLGSLINFCDILMAGGTSRKDHSEVGSSYIHFNFTPHQDKATASLVGDVPRGVFLDQPPIFLGGQGGLVGPARIGFGTVLPAGVVYRGDAKAETCIHYPPALPSGEARPYRTGMYKDIARLTANNLAYIGNLRALRAWYRQVRSRFLGRDPWGRACLDGGLAAIDAMLTERIKRLGAVTDKLPGSIEALASEGRDDRNREAAAQRTWLDAWTGVEAACRADDGDREDTPDAVALLAALEEADPGAYLAAIQSLPRAARAAGTRWLTRLAESLPNPLTEKGRAT